mmetsp:Transcript_20649/g.43400  ORF Transcript_20649/g.43400 Transcript_20649/m.43400 type:complete len:680 (+) Transcript_20649:62-2101(+)
MGGAGSGGALVHALHVLALVLQVLGRLPLLVEVLELLERLALRNQLRHRRRILPVAVPAARGVADAVGRVREPLLRLLGYLADLVDADHVVARGEHLLEERRVHLDGPLLVVGVELVEQRHRHRRRRRAVLVEAEVAAEGVVGADVRVDGVSDARHVRRLGQVVPPAPRPHEDVVGEMAHDGVRLRLLRRQALAEGGDVLVVPGVAVGDGGPVPDARDLVPVVPPGHDAGVVGGAVAQPVVRVEVVVDEHLLAVLEAGAEDDGGVGHAHRHLVAVRRKRPECKEAGDEDEGGDGEAQRLAEGARVQLRPLRLHLLRQQVEGVVRQAEDGRRGAALGPHARLARRLLVPALARRRRRALAGPALARGGRRWRLVLILIRNDELGVQLAQRALHNRRNRHPAQRRCDRARQDDEPHHLEGEEVGDDGVEDEEVLGVRPTEAAHQEPDRREVAHVVEVVPVGLGAGGLVLGDGVDEGVARLGVLHEEPAHARRQRAEVARGEEDEGGGGARGEGAERHLDAQDAHLLVRQVLLPPLDLAVLHHLQDNQDAERAQLLQRLEGGPADDRNLDRSGRPDDVEEGVRPVQLGGMPAKENQEDGVHTDHVEHKDVSTPSSHHVNVRQAGRRAVEPGVFVAEGSNPEEECGAHGCHSNALIIVPTANRSHDMRGNYRHHSRCCQACIR